MAAKIRLSRGGAKGKPYYRIVVTNSRNPRDCKIIEYIGTYNPMLEHGNEKRVEINAERAKYWISVGAQPSDRVQLFLHRAGLVKDTPKQRPARKSKKDKGEAAEGAPQAAPAAVAVEAPAAEAPAAEAPAANDAA